MSGFDFILLIAVIVALILGVIAYIRTNDQGNRISQNEAKLFELINSLKKNDNSINEYFTETDNGATKLHKVVIITPHNVFDLSGGIKELNLSIDGKKHIIGLGEKIEINLSENEHEIKFNHIGYKHKMSITANVVVDSDKIVKFIKSESCYKSEIESLL